MGRSDRGLPARSSHAGVVTMILVDARRGVEEEEADLLELLAEPSAHQPEQPGPRLWRRSSTSCRALRRSRRSRRSRAWSSRRWREAGSGDLRRRWERIAALLSTELSRSVICRWCVAVQPALEVAVQREAMLRPGHLEVIAGPRAAPKVRPCERSDRWRAPSLIASAQISLNEHCGSGSGSTWRDTQPGRTCRARRRASLRSRTGLLSAVELARRCLARAGAATVSLRIWML